MRCNGLIPLIILILIVDPFTYRVSAQNFPFIGARSFGLANVSTLFADEYSVFNNPGTLGYQKKQIAAAGYQNLYQMEGLNSIFGTYSNTIKGMTASLGIFSFGNEIISQDKISVGLGNNFGIAGLGVTFNYHQFQVEGFGSHGFLSLDIGGLAQIGEEILLSGTVKNITQSKISTYSGEYYPTLMSMGVSYIPFPDLSLMAQYDKDLDNPGALKLGIEYSINALVLRTGLLTLPIKPSFGIGFHHKSLKIDYGMQSHQVLGNSHAFSLAYQFSK